MLDQILDNLALALYGMTRTEAHNNWICVECGKSIIERMKQLPKMSLADAREWMITALCPECFNKFCRDMEELDEEEVNYDLPDYMDAGDVAIMEGRPN